MAHLSARHRDAKSRRQNLASEQLQNLMNRIDYPPKFPSISGSSGHASPVRNVRTTKKPSAMDSSPQCAPHYMPPEEIILKARQCQDRVQKAKLEAKQALLSARKDDEARITRSQQAAMEGPLLAKQRLHTRRELHYKNQTQEILSLIEKQNSSLSAMQLKSLIDAAQESKMEKIGKNREILSIDKDEERLRRLLASDQVGQFYT